MSFNILAQAAEQAQAALEAAKAERQAAEAADAAAAWKEQEQVIEDAMEHAGISEVDVQIDENGYAKLVGDVASDMERQTAVSIAEQFELTGLEVEINIIEDADPEVPDMSSVWDAATESAATTYTTKKGDSWWAIAKAFYGDGRKWKQLKRANGWPRMLHPNQDVEIPPVAELSKWEDA